MVEKSHGREFESHQVSRFSYESSLNHNILSFPDNNRVFSDRLVDDHDREVFLNLLSDKLGTMLDFSYHNLCPNKVPPIFGMLLKITKCHFLK